MEGGQAQIVFSAVALCFQGTSGCWLAQGIRWQGRLSQLAVVCPALQRRQHRAAGGGGPRGGIPTACIPLSPIRRLLLGWRKAQGICVRVGCIHTHRQVSGSSTEAEGVSRALKSWEWGRQRANLSRGSKVSKRWGGGGVRRTRRRWEMGALSCKRAVSASAAQCVLGSAASDCGDQLLIV